MTNEAEKARELLRQHVDALTAEAIGQGSNMPVTTEQAVAAIVAALATTPAVPSEARAREVLYREIEAEGIADNHRLRREAKWQGQEGHTLRLERAAIRAMLALAAECAPAAVDMAAFGASDAACYLYPGEYQGAERAAFCAGASHAVSGAHATGMREALQAAEEAEDAREQCPECQGAGQWEHCGSCSERFGRAIVLRRNALACAPAAGVEGEEPFGYWVEQKHADPVLLRKPAYIPEPSDLRTVTPLYAAPAQPAMPEGGGEATDAEKAAIVMAMDRLYQSTKLIGGPTFGQYADAILAALQRSQGAA